MLDDVSFARGLELGRGLVEFAIRAASLSIDAVLSDISRAVMINVVANLSF